MAASSADPAFKDVARITKEASSSFFWAMRLMPPHKRQAMFALYAFCRRVDDIADDPLLRPEEKRARLQNWRRRIDALYDGKDGEETISRALATSIPAFDLQKSDFIAIIDGMEMDADGPIVAPDLATLDLYCDRVASAVGRLSVRIFGEQGDLGRELAHHQGRALQLANILRDVAEDAVLGRLYLPRELLEKHGLDWSDPKAVMKQPGYPFLWRELADKAAAHFVRAYALIERCNADMRTARIMLKVYEKEFRRLCALSDEELANPCRPQRLVPRWEKLLIALAVWTGIA